ncbi:uncharacterized protein LOC131148117 [Malania oleifera]|uniref:uncharacterized protein LOC131148117 n=1 Tax=Malania oleifera TaxID=397392 RepID=UPI0025ADEFE9|nr:uncharacterized protein LOC131148117 [Malania oleifera]
MMRDPILTIPNIMKPFEVQTDALDYILGGVLLQEGYLVTYESRKLSEAERKYTAQETEMLTMIHCRRVWKHYLLGSRFVLKMDNYQRICEFWAPAVVAGMGKTNNQPTMYALTSFLSSSLWRIFR